LLGIGTPSRPNGEGMRWAVVLLMALAIAMPEPQQQPVRYSIPPRRDQALGPGGRLELVAASPQQWWDGSDLGTPSRPDGDGSRLPVLYLQGAPYEMGLQQGTLLRQPLRKLVSEYLNGQIFTSPAIHWGLLNYARFLDRQLSSDLRSEMVGIADGAGLSYQYILLLNVLPDLLALTSQIPSWDLSPALVVASARGAALGEALRTRSSGRRMAPGGSFAIWGAATQSGELFVGHSLGLVVPDLAGHWLLVVRQPTQGNASVSLSQVGSVGAWAGMNEEKVVVALSASTSADIAPLGQPLPFLLREVLQVAGSLDQAREALLGAPRLCGGNVLLADGNAPDAVAIELSAHRQATFEAGVGTPSRPDGVGGDWLARTNHFAAGDLALIQGNVLAPLERAWSEDRLARSSTRLGLNSGWIGSEKAVAFVRSDHDELLSGPHPTDSPEFVYSMLFCPGQLTAWVMQGDTPWRLDLNSRLLEHS